MTAPRRYAKIAITLPEADLASADRLAALQDRSRSWIIAESVRRYAAEFDADRAAAPLGASRLEQLRPDLAPTAHQRVHEADGVAALSAVALSAAPDGAWERPQRFGSFDDFLAWRRATATT